MRTEALWATFGRQVVVWSVGILAMRYKSSWRKCYLLVNTVDSVGQSSVYSLLQLQVLATSGTES